MSRFPSAPWPSRLPQPQQQQQQQQQQPKPAAGGSTIPKRMIFILPGGEPLAYLEFVSILSFIKLHPTWKIEAFRCPSYRRPASRRSGAFPIAPEHIPPGVIPRHYAGRDYWDDLPALGIRAVECSETSEASDLELLAGRGGFHSPASILWIRSLDRLYDRAKHFPQIACEEPNPPLEGDPAFILYAAPANSGTFADTVRYLIAGRHCPPDAFAEVYEPGHKTAMIPPDPFCLSAPPLDGREIWTHCHRELPERMIGIDWRYCGPATFFFRCLLTDQAAVERMGDCTFRYHALQMLAKTK